VPGPFLFGSTRIAVVIASRGLWARLFSAPSREDTYYAKRRSLGGYARGCDQMENPATGGQWRGSGRLCH